jgi:flagellar motor switch protein FliG
MNQLSPAIRKAAVLVSALDERAADALLDQMEPETAYRVRNAVMQLVHVPAAEQQAVLSEFLKSRSSAAVVAPATGDAGVELAPSLVEQLQGPLAEAPPAPAAPIKPLEFLRHVPARELARVLAREHLQTIAVVVAQLETDQAAAVLQRLPAAQAVDVLERLAWLDEPAAEVLADIGRQLRAELAPYMTPSGSRSLANVQALVAAMDSPTRQRVLAGLGEKNGALARQLAQVSESRQEERPTTLPDNYAVTSFRYRLARPDESSAPQTAFADLLALDDEA